MTGHIVMRLHGHLWSLMTGGRKIGIQWQRPEFQWLRQILWILDHFRDPDFGFLQMTIHIAEMTSSTFVIRVGIGEIRGVRTVIGDLLTGNKYLLGGFSWGGRREQIYTNRWHLYVLVWLVNMLIRHMVNTAHCNTTMSIERRYPVVMMFLPMLPTGW